MSSISPSLSVDPRPEARDSLGAIGSPMIEVPLVDPTSSALSFKVLLISTLNRAGHLDTDVFNRTTSYWLAFGNQQLCFRLRHLVHGHVEAELAPTDVDTVKMDDGGAPA